MKIFLISGGVAFVALGALRGQTPDGPPSIETIRSLIEAREATLWNNVTANYSVREKRLFGFDEWIRQGLKNHTIASYPVPLDTPKEGTVELAQDFQLSLSGTLLKLEVVDHNLSTKHPTPALQEEDFQTDGSLSWLYLPKDNWAELLVAPIFSQTIAAEKAWLPAYLTMFPWHFDGVMMKPDEPSLSSLLNSDSGNKILAELGQNGDVILEIRSHGNKSKAGEHILVRTITLGKKNAYFPTRYSAHFEVGDQVFPPSVDVRYDDFFETGTLQIPKKITIINSETRRVRGEVGDPVKAEDIQSYQTEEIIITIDDFQIIRNFPPDYFSFKVLPGMTTLDDYSGKTYTAESPAEKTERIGEDIKKLRDSK